MKKNLFLDLIGSVFLETKFWATHMAVQKHKKKSVNGLF